MVALEDALWYDATPPATTVTRTGDLGDGGWYVGPVTFAMSATDSASGVAETRYRIDDGEWTAGAGSGFTLDQNGQHTVRIASLDEAGNLESPQVFEIAIDRFAPETRLAALNRYQSRPRFDVSWWGFDPSPGSGLAAFDVQVRDGLAGDWQNWLTGTIATTAAFDGQRGHTYFFRIAARDLAGNRRPFSADEMRTTVEAVANGSFDSGNFGEWTASGLLYKAVVPITGPHGSSVLGARLGSEDYGPSLSDPGQVPVGSATISQTLRVPDFSQVARPTLSLWYRVFTYDVMYSERLQRFMDTLEVSLYDAAGQPIALLLREGNPTKIYKVLYDTGWKRALIDLRPYAGQTVQLVIANHNRHDNLFNTWSYVDDVQIQDWPFGVRGYLGLVTGGGAAAAAEPPGVPGPDAIMPEPAAAEGSAHTGAAGKR
jgi:hypothetical protein